ncbi:DegT/DnrJ/EryC1/StrS family aminotransferase [bacterium]|nr:DegT/DnrJ/EryC1/StrS family aminotransferase [bacterium]
MQFIDIQAQYQAYKEAIDQRMRQVMDHGRFIMGPEVAEIEQTLANYVGVTYCITTASGTDSLEIALRALDIGTGDEVITVPFTWISTAEVIAQVGATPVFVDIEAATYNMDVDQLESAITSKTKAIMPVSLFGQMPDLGRINTIAQKHGIPVIEDAAQSFGATQNGKRSCSISSIASTSFFPAKPFGCFGDGGALFTSDEELADKMKTVRNHGGKVRHHHTMVGMNGRFDTLQAAVLLGKFPAFENEVTARNKLGARYSEALRDHCQIPGIFPGNTHVYAQYTIRSSNRDALVAKLKESGIPTAVYYPKCLHEQPVFEPLGYTYGRFPVAEQASREVLSLPMHPFLGEGDQDTVVASVIEALRTI